MTEFYFYYIQRNHTYNIHLDFVSDLHCMNIIDRSFLLFWRYFPNSVFNHANVFPARMFHIILKQNIIH